jgi:hypothetical protein
MAIKDKTKQREYANLSVAISKNKALGKDVSKLISKRDKLVNKSLNKKPTLEFKNQELIYTILEEIKQIKKMLMANSAQPKVSVPLKSEPASSTVQEDKELSLFIEPQLNEKIKQYCLSSPHIFSHASDFIKAAFLAYANQELTLDETLYHSLSRAVAVKKNLKLNPRLRSVYDSFDNKRAKSNQILQGFYQALQRK